MVLSNQSANATSYEWDFCADDFYTLKSFGNSSNINGIANGTGLKVVEDNGIWTGFALGVSSDNLFRLDFGNSPLSAPQVGDLGDPLNILNFPRGIELVKQNGSWYGFVTNNNNGAGITLLNFGSSLTNTPTAQNLGSFGTSDRIWDAKVVKQGSDFILVFAIQNTNQLMRVNFRDSFSNNTSGYVYTSSIPGPNYICGLDAVWTGTTWKILIASNGTNQIYQYDFGNDLLGNYTTDGVYSSIVDKPYKVDVLKEADDYFVTVSGQNGDIRIFNYNDLNPANAPTVLPHTSINTMAGIDAVRFKGKSILMGVGTTSNLMQAVFESICGVTNAYSTSFVPTNILYTSAGTKKIELIATNSASEESSSKGQSVSVTSNIAPDINFTSQNVCVNGTVNFTSQNASGNITSYSWDFGDGATDLINANPSHSYSSASIFYPSLTVTAANSCQNFVQDTLQIFNPPQANYILPVASPLCTNQNYLFTNSSTSDPGSKPTWQWSVNGSNVSTSQDLTYLFTSSASQSVTLTASIPGCSTQSTQNITTLVDGPLISFTAASVACQGSLIPFTNTTTDPVTNFSWSFGDGNSSSQFSASNTYSSIGSYVVNLSGINSNGCQNSYSKNITIYSLPHPDFDIEPIPFRCENSPSYFKNPTQAPVDSNISSWLWKFGDAANGTSTAKFPTYTYSTANSYTVSLIATTNAGCTDSIKHIITILPSPKAGFTNSPACINQSTHFTDTSTGSISKYDWRVQNLDLSGATPSYVFKSSGSFPVRLIVTASNGCLSQITNNVVVPVMPLIDFSVEAPCTGHPTIFQEINSGGSDPATSWNWDFQEGSGIGPIGSHQFSNTGGYVVTLNTTRQSGCVYSTQKGISISTGPIANFTPSVLAGAAPLDVVFNNTSIADSYLWQFGDALPTTSTDSSPEFVYSQLGKYKVLLTAFNNLGCSDTLSTEIDVVIPHIDIVMNNLSLANDPNTNSSKAIVTILNSGNIPLIDPEVLIDFGGSASVKEKIFGLLRPGKSIIQALGLQIVPRSLEYICAEIDVANDVDIHNNKQCVPLSAEDVVLAPYPNPSTDGEITIEWVGATQEDVVITIFKSTGAIAFEQHLDKNSAGLGQLTVNTSSFGDGLYLIQFAGSKTTKTFRIMIAN